MERPFIEISKCHCLACGKESLDVMSVDGVAYRYSTLIKEKNLDRIKKLINYTPLAYMFCSECGTIYHIDWSHGIPQPIYDDAIRYNMFLF